MAGTTTEIMMQFVGTGGPIAAECATAIGPNDDLGLLSVPGYGPGFQPGCYFLVDSFRLGMTLNDSEAASKKPPAQLPPPPPPMKVSPRMRGDVGQIIPHRHQLVPAVTDSSGSFMRWRTATQWNKPTDDEQPYNARMDEFSFTRRMDIASAVLFNQWFNQLTFPFASIIKRKSAPVPDSPLPQNLSYLRIDFADVQISSLQWSDDDVVEESCTFRAKKMQLQYWSLMDEMTDDADSYLYFDNLAEWQNKEADSSDESEQ